MLDSQRGKGAFYWGVGLLVLFIGPDSDSSWGLNNVAALFLAVVGFLHTYVLPGGTADRVHLLLRIVPCPSIAQALFHALCLRNAVSRSSEKR